MIRAHNLSGSVSSFSFTFGKTIRTWIIIMLVILSIIDFSTAGTIERSRQKRSFFDIGCRGVYDKTMFARLDRVCDDCYNLFREPQLHPSCRKDCFTNEFFEGCIEALLLEEEVEKFKMYIKQLRGASLMDYVS